MTESGEAIRTGILSWTSWARVRTDRLEGALERDLEWLIGPAHDDVFRRCEEPPKDGVHDNMRPQQVVSRAVVRGDECF